MCIRDRFLSGPVKGSTQQDTDAQLAAYVQLVRALDAGGSGAVVAAKSNTTDGTKSADLVAAVRKNPDAPKAISTVDDADLPMGQGTLVLCLLYTSDAADDLTRVDLGGCRI